MYKPTFPTFLEHISRSTLRHCNAKIYARRCFRRDLIALVVLVVSQFNGTSTPKGSYSAKTDDNDCNINSSRYSVGTALCESNSLSGQV